MNFSPTYWKEKILEAPIIHEIVLLSKRIVFPGFDGMNIYNVITFFIKGLLKSSITTRASSLAFRFFLALFPSIIFLFSLIPYIPIENFQEELFLLIKDLLPKNAYEMSSETIADLILNKHEGLLSFGFFFALYLAADGVNSMIQAFNESYHSFRKSNFFKQWGVALFLLMVLTILMILSIGSIVFSNFIIAELIEHDILNDDFSIYLVTIGKFIIILLLYFLGISCTYYFGNMTNARFRFISAGSSLATLLSILLSYGFGYYVNNFASYNKIYGSIGTLIVIMLWLYFNAMALLIGYELNASISSAKHRVKEKVK